jgi:hypothetical protein
MFSAFADATLCDYGGLYAQKPQKWAFTVEDQPESESSALKILLPA